jgi:hypothetical protein
MDNIDLNLSGKLDQGEPELECFTRGVGYTLGVAQEEG